MQLGAKRVEQAKLGVQLLAAKGSRKESGGDEGLATAAKKLSEVEVETAKLRC